MTGTVDSAVLNGKSAKALKRYSALVQVLLLSHVRPVARLPPLRSRTDACSRSRIKSQPWQPARPKSSPRAQQPSSSARTCSASSGRERASGAGWRARRRGGGQVVGGSRCVCSLVFWFRIGKLIG